MIVNHGPQKVNHNPAEKLELHYFFDDESHFMDAFIRNKCEADLLAVTRELAEKLGLHVDLDAEALAEGGLVELLKIQVANHPALSAVFIGVLINVLSNQLTTDRELVALQKEECRLQIEKLKYELQKTNAVVAVRSTEATTNILFESHVILKRRSNFYAGMISCQKISALDWVGLDSKNQPTDKRKSIKRDDFHKFLLTSDELEPIIDQEATIGIIAPVLKTGKYKWRGIYKNESISFSMQDAEFKEQVRAGDIPFVNGTCIDCVLTISRKLDESGIEQVSGYTVTVVAKVHDEEASVITLQGKRYKRHQEYEKKALKFDFERGQG
jgi:hypothetical protein